MTTTQNSTAYWTSTAFAVADTTQVQSKKTPTWKLSGEDTPYDHRRWNEDEDELELEQEDDGNSDNHQFGLCCTCKKGLDDRADFVCNNTQQPGGGFYMLCTNCYEDFNKPWYLEETHGGGA